MTGSDFLANRYVVAVGIPLILLFSGALARKIVRKSKWERQDFYLGVKFTLAAMTSALIYTAELARQLTDISDVSHLPAAKKLAASGTFLAATFFLLLWVLSVHQDWEGKDNEKNKQIFWLVGLCNLVGLGLVAAFILLVKGV